VLDRRDHMARTRRDAYFRLRMVDDTRGYRPIRCGDHHSLRAGTRAHERRLTEEARGLLREGGDQPRDLLVVGEFH
jgi:hypothetical protein